VVSLLGSFYETTGGEGGNHVRRHLFAGLNNSSEVGSANCTKDCETAEDRHRHFGQCCLDVEQPVKTLILDGANETGELVVLFSTGDFHDSLKFVIIKVTDLIPEINRDDATISLLSISLEDFATLTSGEFLEVEDRHLCLGWGRWCGSSANVAFWACDNRKSSD